MKNTLRFALLGITSLLIFFSINKNPFDPLFAVTYPAPYQKSYQLFLDRCGNCHSIDTARAVESYLPSDWRDVVDRMQRKPDSGISTQEADEIYKFLVYESTVNHKKELDVQLQQLPEAERKTEENKIKQALH